MLNNIKAPEHLKLKTIDLMRQRAYSAPKRKTFHIVLASTCAVVAIALTGFTFSLFSGGVGDQLSFFTEYKGDGTVAITVENLSNKLLKFSDTVKLQKWSTGEDVKVIEYDMPEIPPGKTEVFVIDYTDGGVNPLDIQPTDDSYYFLFTNNKFINEYSYQASIPNPNRQDGEVSSGGTSPRRITGIYDVPLEDNSSKEDADYIKENYELIFPLEEFDYISCDYNDYSTVDEDGVTVYAHPEIDIAANEGTEIRTLSSGTVIEAGYAEAEGNRIVIDHGNGLVSTYNHCKKLLKKKGETVSLDDVIATVGTTGRSTGNHLGFGIRYNDAPMNPSLLLDYKNKTS